MDGMSMDYPLTINAILRRAETVFGGREIVSQLPDKSLHRYTYADLGRRSRRLALALAKLGIGPGDRVATFAWSHHQHLEAYFGVPIMGAVLHTLNFKLHPDDIAYIVNHAGDRVVLVDDVLLPLFFPVLAQISVEQVIVMSHGSTDTIPEGMLSYEDLLAATDPADFLEPEIDERQAATMCYTSGTTGRPKGVTYSHRALTLHSLIVNWGGALTIEERSVVMPVVPIFHANGWGIPYYGTLGGAKLVLPGPFLDPASLVALMESERVTIAAGVPTIWLGLLQYLDQHPGEFDLSALRCLLSAGQSVPPALLRALKDRYGVDVATGWGMTETGPTASMAYVPSALASAPIETRTAYLTKHGRTVPLVEARARVADDTIAPWDGETMGELEVRGATIISGYYNDPESAARFTADGWLRTGDIATIDPLGYIELRDRAKDLIKSGGEWISSVALENELMAHPAVAEAAVVAAAHPKWLERPVAIVVLKEGATAGEQELRAHLAPHFAKWWLPDAILFVEAIPHTSTGKFMKSALREQYGQVLLERAESQPASVADDD